MKYFKYYFSMWVYVFIALGSCAAITSLVLNIRNLINYVQEGSGNAYRFITIALILLMSLAFLVIVIAMIFKSGYKVEKEKLTVRFGIIKSTFKIKDIVGIRKYMEEKRLVLFFADNSYMRVVVKPELFGEFISSLIEINKKIEFEEKFEDKE